MDLFPRAVQNHLMVHNSPHARPEDVFHLDDLPAILPSAR